MKRVSRIVCMCVTYVSIYIILPRVLIQR